MGDGHVTAPTCFPSFLLPAVSSYPLATWQSNQQAFVHVVSPPGQWSQHMNQQTQPIVGNHVSSTGISNPQPSSIPKDFLKANGDRFDSHQPLIHLIFSIPNLLL